MSKRQFITFRSGEQEFGADIMTIREIRGWTETTPLPHAPVYVRGVINLRGVVLPVVDLKARLGATPTDANPKHVIVVVETGDRTIGLLVDAVSDILTVTAGDIQTTPELARDGSAGFLDGIAVLADRMVTILSMERLIGALVALAAGGMSMPAQQPIAVEGEFAFTWADFHILARLVREESGIVLPEAKANLVYSRLSKRLREIGVTRFADYCTLVDSDAGERSRLIAAMTTNVTRFFREAHHFDHLRQDILPALIRDARAGTRIRIWSSACSSGEEPYSIAMTVADAMPDAAEHDVRILATDLDPNMLELGKAALYPVARLADIPKPLQRFTEDHGAHFRIGAAARKLVSFRSLNLLKFWPVKARYQVIFCRNVMIYFDQPTQDAIWTRFAQHLAPGGMIYIGHSERIATGPYALTAQTAYRRAP